MPEIAQQFMYVHRHSRGECTKRQMWCNWGQILHSQSICCSHDEWQFQYEKLQLQQIGHSIQRLSISTLHEDIRCSLRCFVHKVCVAYSRTVRRSDCIDGASQECQFLSVCYYRLNSFIVVMHLRERTWIHFTLFIRFTLFIHTKREELALFLVVVAASFNTISHHFVHSHI